MIDVDGGQAAELTVLAPDGADAAEAIGARADAPATVVRALVSSMVDGAAGGRAGPRRPRAGPEPRDGRPAVRRVVAAGLRTVVPRRSRGACSSWPRPAGRLVDGAPPPSDLVVEVHRARPRTAQEVELPAAARRTAPRLPDRPVDRPQLRGAGRRVHPGDRRRGQAVLGLPGVPPPQARRRDRTRPRRDRDAHADGQRVPDARAVREVLRRRHGSARRGRPGHGRPARHVRARLQREVLRGHGLPRPRQLHGQLQRDAHRRTRSPSARAGRRSTSSSTPRSTPTTSWSRTSRGRGPATTCSCAR